MSPTDKKIKSIRKSIKEMNQIFLSNNDTERCVGTQTKRLRKFLRIYPKKSFCLNKNKV